MIVTAVTTLGIQCSKCGELQFRTLSLFAFSHFEKESYYCTCGALLMTISRLERGFYAIDYPCIYCGDTHFFTAKRNAIWGDSLLQLGCSDKKLPIGYIGSKQQVLSSCQELKKEFVQFAYQLVNDEEKESEFDNFFIVYAVMEKLGKMVERGQLGCRCGNQGLAVEILPNRIELVCESCRAAGIIYTDNKEILRILDSMGSIFLEENMTWFLNSAYKGNHLIKNK